MIEAQPLKLLTEQEENIIIKSLYNVFSFRDIGYLLPPAFRWIIACNGFKGSWSSWSQFTEQYVDVDYFELVFRQNQQNNRNDAREGTRYYECFEQRESMYDSIIRSIT